ncbi:MAG: polyprenol monophosphomannose synthase [Nitriliruptorales bacterium]|nr:polyprenol monophosphomannose synthase [Nitriliruptorales bacterium]
MRPLIVVPTFNEVDSLPRVIELIREHAPDVDVLVVDDNSPDGTGRVADELSEQHAEVRVLHRPTKLGLGPAYRAGLGLGMEEGREVLVEMDADLSHPAERLPALIAATADADVVLGSRYVPGGATENWPWHRRALSSGGNRYVRITTGMPVRDATSGFRAFRRPVLEAIGLLDLASDGYSFQVETLLRAWRAGFHVTEVPITFTERRSGASKISRRIVFEALWRVAAWGLAGPRRPSGIPETSVAFAEGQERLG